MVRVKEFAVGDRCSVKPWRFAHTLIHRDAASGRSRQAFRYTLDQARPYARRLWRFEPERRPRLTWLKPRIFAKAEISSTRLRIDRTAEFSSPSTLGSRDGDQHEKRRGREILGADA